VRQLCLRYLELLFVFAFVFAADRASVAASSGCSPMKPLPFAGKPDDPLPWRLLHKEGVYCVALDDWQVQTGDVIPLAVERWGEGFAIFGRQRFTGYLSILTVAADGKITPIDMTFDQRSKLHVEAAFSLSNETYLLAYDVAYNLPSGRRREKPREVLGLYRLEGPPAAPKLELLDGAVVEAGLEAGVKVAAFKSGFWLCFDATCRRFELDAGAIPVLVATKGLQIEGGTPQALEIVSDDEGKAYVLAVLIFDDRITRMPDEERPSYFMCTISGAGICDALPVQEIPYQLRIEGGAPRWKIASKRDAATELLEFDLQRAGINGVANFGENNLEGRLAWSQSYYLNGLLSALELGDELGLSKVMRDAIRERFAAEAAEIVALLTRPYPGLLAKRFSLDREPLHVLLHVARILKPVWRGEKYLDSETKSIFSGIDPKFPKSAGSLESLEQSGGMPIARIRQGIPFWADGADLPWNVRSAWIEGVAWQGDLRNDVTSLAGVLVDDFLDKILAEMPEKWPYATGNLLTGWTAKDNVSANTPAYEGDKSNANGAHISYRSMDALAVMAAMRTGLVRGQPYIIEHLGQLVERGLLYPFVNEEFQYIGRIRKIPLSVARFHARSILPWQVQSMPWSLMALPE
jgi:hypothetical protein